MNPNTAASRRTETSDLPSRCGFAKLPFQEGFQLETPGRFRGAEASFHRLVAHLPLRGEIRPLKRKFMSRNLLGSLMLAASPMPSMRMSRAAMLLLRLRQKLGYAPWRPRPKAWRSRRAEKEEQARAYFAQPSRRDLLQVVEPSISTGADLTDYLLLHRYIMARRPQTVLECGSGVTSVIIAHALHEAAQDGAGSPGRLDTMESLPEYFENARSLCPQHLQPFVSYHLSEQVEVEVAKGLVYLGYKDLPPGPFDMIWVDGPSAPGRSSRAGGPMANGDFLRIARRDPDQAFDLVIDKRKFTCEVAHRFWPEGDIKFDWSLDMGLGRQICGRRLLSRPRRATRFSDADALDYLIQQSAESGAGGREMGG